MIWWRKTDLEKVLHFLRRAKLQEIEAWMRRRLHAENDRFSRSRAGQPHFLIVKAYREAEAVVRVNLEFATVNLIRKVAMRPGDWQLGFLDELFLLTDPILLYSKRRAEIVDSALTILRLTTSDPLGTRIACPVAQALLTLDYRGYPRFWMDLYEAHGEIFSPFILEGLGRGSLKTLQDWLLSKLPSARIERDLINILPFFIERGGVPAVVDFLAPLAVRLSPEGRLEIESDAEAGGFRIAWQEEALETTLSDHLANLLGVMLEAKSHKLWETSEARAKFQRALRELGRLLAYERSRGLGELGDSIKARRYSQLLFYGLETKPLSGAAYQEVVENAPMPELCHITEVVIATGHLSTDEIKILLRSVYSEEDARTILNTAHREASRLPEGNLKGLTTNTQESILWFRSLERLERDLVQELIDQDRRLPEANVWVPAVATGGIER